MIYTICNDFLSVDISSFGGELQSIRRDGLEYLWQGNPEIWKDRSPVLFPYIGRMTNGAYTLDGKSYEMKIHGFVKLSELTVAEKSGQSITFLLKSSDETRGIYPRDFTFLLQYRLEDNSIVVACQVVSQDSRELYFGLGGHPGFRVPLEDGLEFTDYRLEFGSDASPLSVVLSPACFVTDDREPFPLENNRSLPLRHQLFDNDAIILEQMSSSVSLLTDKGNRGVTVSYPQMKYLGFWHKPNSEAPYVCIEPWSSLPSRQDVVEDLSTQPDLIHLAAGETYTNTWTITVHS